MPNSHKPRGRGSDDEELSTRFAVLRDGKIFFEGTPEELEAVKDPYLKVQVLELPALSVAVQVTLVQPSGNLLPDGGTQTMVGAGSQLSLAVMSYFTRAPFGLAQRM